jgi:hypothetical protein
MRITEIKHYPFKAGESGYRVDSVIFGKITNLFKRPLFLGNEDEFASNLIAHYQNAKNLFAPEQKLRRMKAGNADLYYHGIDHSIYQTPYDSISVTDAILARNDAMSSHLTPEGIFAIPYDSIYHDTGFVYGADNGRSFAKRNPIHVEKSIEAALAYSEKIGLPASLDHEKIRHFIVLGIHGTHFPYDEERRRETRLLLDKMPAQWRKEAQIVRLAVQFADLAGQTARIDQYPEGLKKLRKEMNACTVGIGNQIVGKNDEEIEENWRGFIENVIERTVGKSGNAFFGPDNSFRRQWRQTLKASR